MAPLRTRSRPAEQISLFRNKMYDLLLILLPLPLCILPLLLQNAAKHDDQRQRRKASSGKQTTRHYKFEQGELQSCTTVDASHTASHHHHHTITSSSSSSSSSSSLTHPLIIYSELGQTVFLGTSRRLTRVDSCLAHSLSSWSWWAQFMMASHFVRRRPINAETSLRSSKTVP